MKDPAATFVEATDANVVGRILLPPRAERRAAMPDGYRSAPMRNWFQRAAGSADTLWHHQAAALSQTDAGRDVVVATGTASGKSLVFQAPIIREMLESNKRAIVLYPQISLCSDQATRWERGLEAAGLDPGLVGQIHGQIPPDERARVLNDCRVIVATPDTVHSWLMPQVAAPAGQALFNKLEFVVLDEAHLYDSVFGSNGGLLMRRLECAARRYGSRFQYIAASATIANPAEHLANLTGRAFVAIEEHENGAPFHGLTILHIEGPDHGAAAEKMLTDTLAQLTGAIAPDAFIAFMDSRQGAEKIAKNLGHESVLPYRSGYEAEDRRIIERKMREAELLGVVSTSALEVGIDIPQFIYGLNVGLPNTRKAFRQRVGRIGRSSPGVFALIAPATAFAQLGTTFEDFFTSEAEPANLYLSNRFIQFQQARCLIAELGLDDGEIVLPDCACWPAGFAEMFRAAVPGAVRPRDLDVLASLGADSPHHAYPLRRIGDVSYTIKPARGGDDVIGRIELDKAMREAHPGATYHHLKQSFRVLEWRSRRHEHVILVERAPGPPTRPMLRTQVNFALSDGGLIADRHLVGDRGSLSEVAIGVLESVEGYTIGKTAVPYREASKKDPRLSRKQREFSTTGAVLRIDSPAFKGSAEHQVSARFAVARALATLLARNESISPQDVRFVHTGTALLTPAGARKVDDAIVIFDAAMGGLRLTAPLFDNFHFYLDQLEKGVELAHEDALVSEALVRELREWHATLARPRDLPVLELPPGSELIVFAPESEVALRYRGTLVQRKLLRPELVTVDDEDRLMYRYESFPGVTALVAHDRCEPVGQDWRRMFWNPDTNELREIEA